MKLLVHYEFQIGWQCGVFYRYYYVGIGFAGIVNNGIILLLYSDVPIYNTRNTFDTRVNLTRCHRRNKILFNAKVE